MNFFHKNKIEQHIALILDIGSASIGAALILYEKGANPKILYTTRQDMVFQKDLDFKRFEMSMLKNLENISKIIEREGLEHLTVTHGGHKHISHILAVYASPWYISRTKKLVLKKEHPFVLKKEHIEELARKEEEAILKSVEGPVTEKALGGVYSIEKQVVDVRVSGYHVSEPFGRKITEADITLFFTMISKNIVSEVEKILRKSFSPKYISHHSFSVAGFSVLRDYPDTPSDFLFIDIGGEITDISLVRGGTLLETVTFPKGKFYVSRRLGELLKVNQNEVFSLLRMKGESSSHNEALSTLEPALKIIEIEWENSFRETLGKISGEIVLPSNVYLACDTEVQTIFTDWIKESTLKHDMLGAGEFTVTPLGEKRLYDQIAMRAGVRSDPFLAISTIYFNRQISLL